ncbi:unnamed protein product [Ilex paraguariensis]|uniref:Uncharacterized protein n=2 Tax=Ilex paraguariensis TaxID=185542 RepID=A0ABC8UW16_9AQUA
MYAGNLSKMNAGALAIAVPGQLAGLYTAWKQYGRLPWKRLVSPAENLARKGFKISPYLFRQMRITESYIKADKGLREIYAPRGNLLQSGQTISNKNLANTLSEISKYGMDAFYNGSIGRNLVTDIRKAGGIVTMEDLQSYRVKFREPIVANVFGFKVFTVPPPASGGAVLILMLNILAQYSRSGLSGSLGVHRIIEALKHALAMRMNLGDPDFVDVWKVLSSMISPSFAARLKNSINDNKTFDSDYYGSKWDQVHDHGTTNLCIVDRERNVVAMTTSINTFFGSKFLSPSTGIVLNNQMNDFSIPTATVSRPAPANFIHPSKRPLSTMAPTIILKGGRLRAVIGSSGGMAIPDALYPNVLYYENFKSIFGDQYEASAQTRAALQKKGHTLRSTYDWTICTFIVREFDNSSSGKLVAVSDPRKGGFPSGY